MKLKVNAELKTLRAKLKKAAARKPKTLVDYLEQEARLVAISCATEAQPFGTGESSKLSGEKRTAHEIHQCYISTSGIFNVIKQHYDEGRANKFWRAIKSGYFDVARAVMTSINYGAADLPIRLFDGGAFHKSVRNSRGRVERSQHAGMIVTDGEKLTAYVEAKVALVGFGKAAWANIASQLGGTRGLKTGGDISASWILRHRGAPFRIERHYTDSHKPRITLTSTVNYADQILSPRNKAQAVMIAYDRLLKSTRIALAAEMRAELHNG